jgi:hypothetical protein
MCLYSPSKGFMSASLAIVADAPARAVQVIKLIYSKGVAPSRTTICVRAKSGTHKLRPNDSLPHLPLQVPLQLHMFQNVRHVQVPLRVSQTTLPAIMCECLPLMIFE